MVNELRMIDGTLSFLRKDSILDFSKDNSTLGLNQIISNFDNQVSSVIKVAYDYIGGLNLLRANRPDVDNDIKEKGVRCVSIDYIREQVNEKVSDNHADFSDSQIEAMQSLRATVTKQIYDGMDLQNSEIQCEGYCGEHAYLLLGSLLEQGLSSRNLRVINLDGKDKDDSCEIDHSFLAYCSHGLEDSSDIESVMRIIYGGHKNALFLNPWGKEKIFSLNMCERKEDFLEIFHKMMLEVDGKFDPSSLKITVDIPIITSYYTDSETDISNSGSLYSEDFNETVPHLAQHTSEYVSSESKRKRTLSEEDLSGVDESPLKKPG